MTGENELRHEMYEIQAYKALRMAVEEERDFAAWFTGLMSAVCARTEGGIEGLIAGRPGSWESAGLANWLRTAGCEQQSQREMDEWLAQRLEDDDMTIQERMSE